MVNVGNTLRKHPLNDIFYRFYGYHSQSWLVYGIVSSILVPLPYRNESIKYPQLSCTTIMFYPIVTPIIFISDDNVILIPF